MTSDLEIEVNRKVESLNDSIHLRLHFDDHMGYYQLTENEAWDLGNLLLDEVDDD